MDSNVPTSPVLEEIRKQVKARLLESPAYRSLDADKRKQIARDSVKALAYIVGGAAGDSVPTAMTLAGNARAFAPAPVTKAAAPVRRIQAPQGGQGDIAESARAGGQVLTDTIADVNFPAFVGGLIDGVFNSIVTTSIKQMEAYAEMVKNVSKSVDQYMKDNVSENNARDYLSERYPDHLELDIGGEKPRLKPKDGYDDATLPDFFSDLGLKAPLSSLDDDTCEEQLVPAARRRIAMDRQQLLATMVMMGVNRLVVTNGTIEASCFFELDTRGVRKDNRATTAESESTRERTGDWGGEGGYTFQGKGDGGWGWRGANATARGNGEYAFDEKQSWYSKGTSKDTARFKVTTVSTKADEQTINMHAQLGGKVKVNFKSDYFPMEKMIDALQVNMIRDKTNAGIAPQQPQQPLLTAPPPPPLPPSPGVTPAPAQPAPAPAPAQRA
jgi:hypothetical protein